MDFLVEHETGISSYFPLTLVLTENLSSIHPLSLMGLYCFPVHILICGEMVKHWNAIHRELWMDEKPGKCAWPCIDQLMLFFSFWTMQNSSSSPANVSSDCQNRNIWQQSLQVSSFIFPRHCVHQGCTGVVQLEPRCNWDFAWFSIPRFCYV